MRSASLLSRRSLLGAFVVGIGALVSACGAAPASETPPTQSAPQAPIVKTGGSGAPAVSPSTGPDPLSAVAVVPSPTALAQRGIAYDPPVTETAIPPTELPPTAVPPTPTPVPTVTPLPTATPIPYNAARLTDLLGESITSYAGSVPPRANNVRLATKLINGATVAPGEVFSFDDVVGDQTQAHGFQIAWGIINKDGVPETVRADAGGICQVATTVFQSVYWAGLPLVKRYHHLYWIAHYGEPPFGGIGLDATVDFPPVDLQFRNTTSDWIRVDATYDATHVHVRLVGVHPGWKVSVGTPKITNMVKTDRTLVRRPDPTMNPGQELYIETAQDGFDVTVERLVKSKSGELVDKYVFTNHYESARNVMVYGTKGLPTPPTPGPVTPTVVGQTPTPPPGSTTPAAAVTPTVPQVTPTAVAGKQADGKVKVPSVVGMPEAQARSTISSLGLQNTFTNYQGPGEVPAAALNQVPVGSVLSQTPAPNTAVAPGSTVYIAVRKA